MHCTSMIVYVCVRVCLGAQCSVSRYTAPIFVSNKVCARDPLSLPSTCPQFFFIHIFKHLLSHLHFYNLMSLHHFPSLLSPLLSSPLLTSPHLTSFFPLFVNHLLISSSTPFLTIITFHPQGELPPELGRVAFSNQRASCFIEACLQHRDKRPSATELLAEDFLKPNEVRI